MLCDRMQLDVWEVIDAAATKPYGFMRFTPGPGLGGHCIPIDPFYLSWRARQFDFQTEFIELAGKVNTTMPYFCAERISQALNQAPQAGQRQPRAGAGRVLQARRRRRARVAGAEADRAAGRAGRRHQLPRPARARPARAGARPAFGAAGRRRRRGRRHRLRRHRPLRHRLRRPGRSRAAGVRLPKRRPTRRRKGASCCERSPSAWVWSASATGARTWPATSRSCPMPSCAGAATRTSSSRPGSRRSSPRHASRRRFDDLIEDETLDAVVVATPVPTHHAAGPARLAGRQARVRGEADGLDGRRGPGAARHWPPNGRGSLMVGHLLRFHPAVVKLRELIESGELGDVLLRVRQPPEPGRDPRGRKRALEPGRARHLGRAVPARRTAGRGVGAGRVLPPPRRRGRRVRLPEARPRARSATCTCHGSTPTRCAR